MMTSGVDLCRRSLMTRAIQLKKRILRKRCVLRASADGRAFWKHTARHSVPPIGRQATARESKLSKLDCPGYLGCGRSVPSTLHSILSCVWGKASYPKTCVQRGEPSCAKAQEALMLSNIPHVLARSGSGVPKSEQFRNEPPDLLLTSSLPNRSPPPLPSPTVQA